MSTQGLLGILSGYSPQTIILGLLGTFIALAIATYLWIARGRKLQQEEAERQRKKKQQEEEEEARLKKEREAKKEKKKIPVKPQKPQDHPLFVTALKGHSDEVTGIAFNPKGSFLASFSKDRTLRFFDTSNLAIKDSKHQRINLDLDYGERATFSADGRYLITVMADTKNFRIYELKKSKEDKNKYEPKAVKEFANLHKAELNTLVMASNSKFILSCSNDNSLILWGIPHANILENLSVKKGGNFMAALSPDAKYFTIAVATGEVVLWEILTKKADNWEFDKTKKVTPLPNGHRTAVHAVCFSPDGHSLLTGSKDCTWRLWDVNVRFAVSEDPKCIHNVKMEHPIDNLSFSPDGKVIMVLCYGDLHFFDSMNAAPLDTIPSPHGANPLLDFTWSPDSQFLATAGVQDRVIKLWRVPHPSNATPTTTTTSQRKNK